MSLWSSIPLLFEFYLDGDREGARRSLTTPGLGHSPTSPIRLVNNQIFRFDGYFLCSFVPTECNLIGGLIRSDWRQQLHKKQGGRLSVSWREGGCLASGATSVGSKTCNHERAFGLCSALKVELDLSVSLSAHLWQKAQWHLLISCSDQRCYQVLFCFRKHCIGFLRLSPHWCDATDSTQAYMCKQKSFTIICPILQEKAIHESIDLF